MTREPYLWDRSGEPDPDVTALEGELARHRWSGQLPAEPLPPIETARRRWRERWARVAPLATAAGVAAALLAGWWWWSDARHEPAARLPASPVYHAQALTGALANADLRPGDRLVTDAATHARLQIGEIGSLIVEPGTSLRMERPRPELAADAEHLLWLERGAITASIFAAPRLFQLGTPSGIAVDLGCIYTARVEDDGSTRLSVDMGQVSFETPERRVIVPSGASTRAWPDAGPGTPVWDDAPEPFRAHVARLDALLLPGSRAGQAGARGSDDVATALATVLRAAQQRDTLTLWHLLAWPLLAAEQRGRVAEQLAALSAPPAGVTQQACLALDAEALDGWRRSLGWSW